MKTNDENQTDYNAPVICSPGPYGVGEYRGF